MAFGVCGFSEKGNTILQQKTADNVCKLVIAAMVNALPENLQTIEVFNYILKQSQQMLLENPVRLNWEVNQGNESG